jgi:hypothetical protein
MLPESPGISLPRRHTRSSGREWNHPDWCTSHSAPISSGVIYDDSVPKITMVSISEVIITAKMLFALDQALIKSILRKCSLPIRL